MVALDGSRTNPLTAGFIFEVYGNYAPAFVSAALMAVLAAALTMLIREEPVITSPLAPAPATTYARSRGAPRLRRGVTSVGGFGGPLRGPPCR